MLSVSVQVDGGHKLPKYQMIDHKVISLDKASVAAIQKCLQSKPLMALDYDDKLCVWITLFWCICFIDYVGSSTLQQNTEKISSSCALGDQLRLPFL